MDEYLTAGYEGIEVEHGSGMGAFLKWGGTPHYLSYPYPYPGPILSDFPLPYP